ncbi:hypothetical protein HK405_011536, partial [Cladochytrium tenue]
KPAWLAIELVPLIVYPLAFAAARSRMAAQAVPLAADRGMMLLVLWCLHYFNRSVVHTLVCPSIRPWPVVLLLIAVSFNAANAYVNGSAAAALVNSAGRPWLSDPRFLLAVAGFLAAMAANVAADHTLFALRRARRVSPQPALVAGRPDAGSASGDYGIPRGSLFELVSCPNYLAELMEWTLYSAASSWSPAAVTFTLFTAANLVPRAISTHRWYRVYFVRKGGPAAPQLAATAMIAVGTTAASTAASAATPPVASPSASPLLSLPHEALWRVFVASDSPKLVFNLLPHVCRRFHDVVRSFAVPTLAHLDLVADDDPDDPVPRTDALLYVPEPARLLNSFRIVRLRQSGSSPVRGAVPPPTVSTSTDLHATEGDAHVVHVAAERYMRIHIAAIPPNPDSLVAYTKDLLRRNAFGPFSLNGLSVNIIIGNVQSITLWWWDPDLIDKLQDVCVPTARLPNMRTDGHVQPKDMAVVARSRTIRRLELFRPMPRQPWGLEARAFSPLAAMPELRELVVRSGRLIGSQEALVSSLVQLKFLAVLEVRS